MAEPPGLNTMPESQNPDTGGHLVASQTGERRHRRPCFDPANGLAADGHRSDPPSRGAVLSAMRSGPVPGSAPTCSYTAVGLSHATHQLQAAGPARTRSRAAGNRPLHQQAPARSPALWARIHLGNGPCWGADGARRVRRGLLSVSSRSSQRSRRSLRLGGDGEHPDPRERHHVLSADSLLAPNTARTIRSNWLGTARSLLDCVGSFVLAAQLGTCRGHAASSEFRCLPGVLTEHLQEAVVRGAVRRPSDPRYTLHARVCSSVGGCSLTLVGEIRRRRRLRCTRPVRCVAGRGRADIHLLLPTR